MKKGNPAVIYQPPWDAAAPAAGKENYFSIL